MMGAGSAENSNGGLTFNMVTRSGANQLHGGAMYNGTLAGARQHERTSPTRWRRSCWPLYRPRCSPPTPTSSPTPTSRRCTTRAPGCPDPSSRTSCGSPARIHKQRLDSYKLGSYNPDGTQVLDDNDMWTVTAKATWQINRSVPAVVLPQSAVQADRPSRRRHVRRQSGPQLQRQIPHRQPGQVQLDDRLEQGLRRDLQPLPRRRCVRLAAGSEPWRYRRVRHDDADQRSRAADLSRHRHVPGSGAHDAQLVPGKARPQGRLRIRVCDPHGALLVHIGSPLELRERCSDLREHLPRAGHAVGHDLRRRHRRVVPVSCRTSMVSSSRTAGRRRESSSSISDCAGRRARAISPRPAGR